MIQEQALGAPHGRLPLSPTVAVGELLGPVRVGKSDQQGIARLRGGAVKTQPEADVEWLPFETLSLLDETRQASQTRRRDPGSCAGAQPAFSLQLPRGTQSQFRNTFVPPAPHL